jgi:hypothetical protein
MSRLRILFADDQIPSSVEDDNLAVARELTSQLGAKFASQGRDLAAAIREDREWFDELTQRLARNFDLVRARTAAVAEARLRDPEAFDIAILDLSWTGDASLALSERPSQGFKLLDLLSDPNADGTLRKPAIAFSQNFRSDSVLFGDVLRRGALPVPKDYTKTPQGTYPGHDALVAAVEYLALSQLATPRKKPPADLTIGELLKGMKPAQLWGVLAALAAAYVATATTGFAFGRAAARTAYEAQSVPTTLSSQHVRTSTSPSQPTK